MGAEHSKIPTMNDFLPAQPLSMAVPTTPVLQATTATSATTPPVMATTTTTTTTTAPSNTSSVVTFPATLTPTMTTPTPAASVSDVQPKSITITPTPFTSLAVSFKAKSPMSSQLNHFLQRHQQARFRIRNVLNPAQGVRTSGLVEMMPTTLASQTASPLGKRTINDTASETAESDMTADMKASTPDAVAENMLAKRPKTDLPHMENSNEIPVKVTVSPSHPLRVNPPMVPSSRADHLVKPNTADFNEKFNFDYAVDELEDDSRDSDSSDSDSDTGSDSSIYMNGRPPVIGSPDEDECKMMEEEEMSPEVLAKLCKQESVPDNCKRIRIQLPLFNHAIARVTFLKGDRKPTESAFLMAVLEVVMRSICNPFGKIVNFNIAEEQNVVWHSLPDLANPWVWVSGDIIHLDRRLYLLMESDMAKDFSYWQEIILTVSIIIAAMCPQLQFVKDPEETMSFKWTYYNQEGLPSDRHVRLIKGDLASMEDLRVISLLTEQPNVEFDYEAEAADLVEEITTEKTEETGEGQSMFICQWINEPDFVIHPVISVGGQFISDFFDLQEDVDQEDEDKDEDEEEEEDEMEQGDDRGNPIVLADEDDSDLICFAKIHNVTVEFDYSLTLPNMCVPLVGGLEILLRSINHQILQMRDLSVKIIVHRVIKDIEDIKTVEWQEESSKPFMSSIPSADGKGIEIFIDRFLYQNVWCNRNAFHDKHSDAQNTLSCARLLASAVPDTLFTDEAKSSPRFEIATTVNAVPAKTGEQKPLVTTKMIGLVPGPVAEIKVSERHLRSVLATGNYPNVLLVPEDFAHTHNQQDAMVVPIATVLRFFQPRPATASIPITPTVAPAMTPVGSAVEMEAAKSADMMET